MPAPVPCCPPRHVARLLLTCLGVFLAAPALMPELAAAELVVRNLYADLDMLPADFAFEVDVTGRWQTTSYDLTGSGVDATMDRAGFCASPGFLCRLSNQPSLLG